MKDVYIISCTKNKKSNVDCAGSIYKSANYTNAKRFSIKHSDVWLILSAKYGLLMPDEIISKYDLNIIDCSYEYTRKWADDVISRINNLCDKDDRIFIFATNEYSSKIVDRIEEVSPKILLPYSRLHCRSFDDFNNFIAITKKRRNLLDRLYAGLDILRNGLGGGRIVKECSGTDKWPEKGVYLLFENGEYRFFNNNTNRIVRVGTHAISDGSKASLWNRIRTHKGTKGGVGNHRSSVFRLHVGASLINKLNCKDKFPKWGIGQSSESSLNRDEMELEQMVSNYIGEMNLLWIDIADDTSSKSDRAYIEQNMIAIISGDMKPIDLQTENWLGNYNAKRSISYSGLWNVNHVSDGYDEEFIKVFEKYIDITLNKRKYSGISLAPLGWGRKNISKSDINQMKLFGGEDD